MTMIYDTLLSTAATLVVSGPAEWAIHKYVLHANKKLREIPFMNKAATSHNDNHHSAYMAPEHYYRDLTNEHVLVHFAPSNVAQIAVGGALFGAGLGAVTPLSAVGGAIGGVIGTMTTYGLYEFTHHYMHVVGERRLEIGRVFGDLVENGERSGKLRLPKPTLDALCTVVDDKLDGRDTSFKYMQNCRDVLADQNYNFSEADLGELLAQTTKSVSEWEQDYLLSASSDEAKKYHSERKMHRLLRHSSLFERLDHHHFVHHRKYGANLNIVWMWFDHLIGTKEDSSPDALLANSKYWLCPNSPDIDKFTLKS
jgi:hypothetical protein